METTKISLEGEVVEVPAPLAAVIEKLADEKAEAEDALVEAEKRVKELADEKAARDRYVPFVQDDIDVNVAAAMLALLGHASTDPVQTPMGEMQGVVEKIGTTETLTYPNPLEMRLRRWPENVQRTDEDGNPLPPNIELQVKVAHSISRPWRTLLRFKPNKGIQGLGATYGSEQRQ